MAPMSPATPPATPAATLFEFSGGALCLDFVNSWGDRDRSQSDRMTGFGDLLAFATQAGLVDAARHRELTVQAGGDSATRAFTTTIALREALYRIFSSCARQIALSPDEVETLNGVLREAFAHLRIETLRPDAPSSFAWSFEPLPLPTSPLWPIARSAADLLTSPDLERVTQCDGDGCTWLFLDDSRTQNRRWCSMQSCGNRAKARRHYHRSRS